MEATTPTHTDANGLVWSAGGPETDDHLTHGGHETALVQIAKGLLPEGGNFLDVGAHVGLYTLNLALKASNVYSIEANPKTYAVLMSNIAANADQHTCAIHAVNIAAWDSVAYLSLEDANGKETGGSTRCVVADSRLRFKQKGQVDAAPLDFFLPGPVDLVKIDVEGAEARVLRGMEGVIANCAPTLLIEMHDVEYDDPSIRTDVLNFLAHVGYTYDDSLKHGGQYYIVAKHKDAEEALTIETVKAGQ